VEKSFLGFDRQEIAQAAQRHVWNVYCVREIRFL